MPLFHPDIRRQQIAATLFYWFLLPLLVLGPGLALDRLLSLGWWSSSLGNTIIALFFLLGGLGLVIRSTRDLQELGNGTPSPLRPARQLITGGSYRLCRHPMFFGYDLMLLAAICFLRSPAALGICYPIFLLWSVIWLRKEERILASRFRETYPLYRQEVPFLIPRLKIRPKP